MFFNNSVNHLDFFSFFSWHCFINPSPTVHTIFALFLKGVANFYTPDFIVYDQFIKKGKVHDVPKFAKK